MANILTEANDVLIDFDGKRAYLTDDALWVYDTADTNVTDGYVTSNNSDLGYPDVDKLLNYIDVDYKGTVQVIVYQDGNGIHIFNPPDKTSRGTKWLYLPLRKRKAFQKIKIVLASSDPDAIIYGVELDFSVLKRRRT